MRRAFRARGDVVEGEVAGWLLADVSASGGCSGRLSIVVSVAVTFARRGSGGHGRCGGVAGKRACARAGRMDGVSGRVREGRTGREGRSSGRGRGLQGGLGELAMYAALCLPFVLEPDRDGPYVAVQGRQ